MLELLKQEIQKKSIVTKSCVIKYNGLDIYLGMWKYNQIMNHRNGLLSEDRYILLKEVIGEDSFIANEANF